MSRNNKTPPAKPGAFCLLQQRSIAVSLLLLVSLTPLMVVACGSDRTPPGDQAEPRQQTAAGVGVGRVPATPARERVQQDENDDKTPLAADHRKKKPADPNCVRIEWQTRNVASMAGGAMQMIQVPVCIKAKGAADQREPESPRR